MTGLKSVPPCPTKVGVVTWIYFTDKFKETFSRWQREFVRKNENFTESRTSSVPSLLLCVHVTIPLVLEEKCPLRL